MINNTLTRVPDCESAGTAKRSYPASEVGARPRGDTPRPKPEARGGWRKELTYAPKPKARGGRREELPHDPMPEARVGGREDQPHVQGAMAVWAQEGLEELSHGRVVVRRYPSSKVRSSGCALLEQL